MYKNEQIYPESTLTLIARTFRVLDLRRRAAPQHDRDTVGQLDLDIRR